MKKSGYLLFLLLICVSCIRIKRTADTETFLPETFTEGSYVYYPIKNNRITVDLDKPEHASLFDYFKYIELIPLETNDEVLIGRLGKVIYNQNNYYTLDMQQSIVHIFDEAGNFVSKIDRRGNGPGDYIRLENMIINPFTGHIDLLEATGRLFSYDLSGNHVKTIWVDYETDGSSLPAVHDLVALDENTYVIFSWAYNPKIHYFDTESNRFIHHEYEESEFAESVGFTQSNTFHTYHGKWYFSRPLNPVIYELGPDSLVMAYRWDFGKYNYDANTIDFPEELRNNTPGRYEMYSRLPYQLRYPGQNNRYVMALKRIDLNTYNYLMYDKSIQECKYIIRFDEQVEFRPYTVTNEYVLSWCIHGDLEKYITKELLDEANLQKFEDLINAKEEENPIIIKYYFK